MAPKPVTLTFAGDSSSLEKTFENVGSGAKEMAGDFDKAQSEAKSLDGAMGKVGATVDSSESKFMGTADVLDGLATTMGLNVGAQIDMARGFGDIAGGLTNLAPLLSSVATKIGLTSAATWLWNAAQTALNVVMSLNPIMLVVLAIGALVAAIVVAYKNSETFRDIVDAAFRAVARVVGDVIGWILDGIGQFLGGLAKVFDIAGKIPGVGDKFRGVADAIRGAQSDVQGLSNKMHGLGDETNRAARFMGSLETHLRNVNPLVGPSTDLGAALGIAGMPQKRQHGGPVTAGRAYIVGERQPELFIPGRSGTIVPSIGGGGQTVVHLSVATLDPAAAGPTVIRAIEEYEARNGTRFARAV